MGGWGRGTRGGSSTGAGGLILGCGVLYANIEPISDKKFVCSVAGKGRAL